MSKYILVPFLLLLLNLPVCTPLYAQTQTLPAPAKPKNEIETTIKTALQHLKGGEYDQARKLYGALLNHEDLTKEQKKSVHEIYGKLNMKLLFSRNAMENSTFHEVVPGDSLYKISKKYGTTIDLIKKSNALEKDVIHPGMKLKVVDGKFSIHIDKSDNELTLFLEGDEIKRYQVATGEKNSTPVGSFKIVNKLTDPTWYKSGAVISPDSPENELGTRWLGFDHPGYGIHGTIEPESIGKQASAGCVRMLNEEVEELFTIVPQGAQVTIAD